MKNSWLVWLFVVVVIVTIVAVFNHQQAKKQKSLSEIFPTNEEVMPVDVEYEYVDSGAKSAAPATAPAPKSTGKSAETAMATAPSTTSTSTPKVNVEAPKMEAPSSNVALPAYTIQVGSHKKQSEAEAAVAKLQKDGHDAFMVSRDLGAKGMWYRVYVGHFASKAEARAYLPKVQTKYTGAFVIAPK
jgi:cell division septation protein DedD